MNSFFIFMFAVLLPTAVYLEWNLGYLEGQMAILFSKWSFVISDLVKPFLRCCDFQEGGRHHVGFRKSRNFIGWRVMKAESHYRAKLRQNCSVHYGDIVIFRLSMIATVRQYALAKSFRLAALFLPAAASAANWCIDAKITNCSNIYIT